MRKKLTLDLRALRVEKGEYFVDVMSAEVHVRTNGSATLVFSLRVNSGRYKGIWLTFYASYAGIKGLETANSALTQLELYHKSNLVPVAKVDEDGKVISLGWIRREDANADSCHRPETV